MSEPPKISLRSKIEMALVVLFVFAVLFAMVALATSKGLMDL